MHSLVLLGHYSAVLVYLNGEKGMDSSQISFLSKGLQDLGIASQVEVNPLTGTANISVPLSLTPGRSGFGPSLTLEYNSSAGNSVYGMGWSLAGLPSIGLSSKQHPKYTDEDNFVFNGADELVPALRPNGNGYEPRIESIGEYQVRYYRSKFENNYIRFEKWIHLASGRIHWRTRAPDNTISIFGSDSTGNSRISDPEDPSQRKTYLWLLEAQYDRLGNAVLYEYTPENSENLDFGQSYEIHRIILSSTFPQRYLKRILYGNTSPLEVNSPLPEDNRWLFEVVFDYGERTDELLPSRLPDRSWPVRPDPYSSCHPGFEVRTYRLCRRILMFHHFEELSPEATLIGCTELNHREDSAGTTLRLISYTGYRRDLESGEISHRSLPPLLFEYTPPTVGRFFEAAPEQTKENFPYGLGDSRYRWVDLYGEGLPGILTETNQAWYYKPNLGHGRFGPQQKVADKPSQRVGGYALTDFDRDGNLNLVIMEGRQAGYCEYDRNRGQWNGFRPFSAAPHIDSLGSRAQWLDLNGDGLPDILISRQDRFTWYPSEGRDGYGAAVELAKPQAASQAQAITENLSLDLFFADMNGDGMLDQVHIQNGRIEYWPQLGNGRFGDCVVMEGAPTFDHDTEFDPSRLRLVDLDGSGTTDLLYIGRGEIRYWINACGNRFVEGGHLTDLPYIENLSTVQVLDFLGDGTPCLVWSSPLVSYAEEPIRYLRLTNGLPPRLLTMVNNSMGQETELVYSFSSSHYLRDKETGRGWISKLPSHSMVVDQKIVKDLIGGSRLVSRYEYHDGHFDGKEREFRGFGLVDQFDAKSFVREMMIEECYTPPSCVRTWFHNGAFGWDAWRTLDYYSGDPEHDLLPPPVFEEAANLNQKEFEDGYRALAGQVIRREIFAVTLEGYRADHPYQVTQAAYHLRRLQPAQDEQDACFTFVASESLTHEYEQQPDDPRIIHSFVMGIDAYGFPRASCTAAYSRRSGITEAIDPQQRHYLSAAWQDFIHIDEPGRYELGIASENKEFEIGALVPIDGSLFRFDELAAVLPSLLDAPLDFHETIDDAGTRPQARLIGWIQNCHWNDDLTAVLPLGEVGQRALLHHQESACFDEPLLEIFEDRVDPTMLESEGRYVLRDSYWWRPSTVQHYLSAEGFFAVAQEDRLDGGITQYTYDAPYYLTLRETVDAMGNRTRAEIDYNLIAPHRITDPNENTAEVLYDPLSMIIVSTAQGSVLSANGELALYGNELLSAYTLQPEPDFASILAEPSRFLQGASQFLYYDLHTWKISGQPPHSISLVREDFVHDCRGGENPESRIQTTVAYRDGYSRALQSKLRVEPGPAMRRDETGAVVLDVTGRPEEEDAAERWLVSGHTVYNNKQQPVRQYEPSFDTIPEYTSEAALQTFGVSTFSHYDSIGRLIRQDFPNGTLIRVETTPWEVRSYDPNDTVADSLYRIDREALAETNPKRQALNKALAHADTPAIVRRDPLGREVEKIETSNDHPHRVTCTRLDIQGNTSEIIDPRGLSAFQYRYDMLGRLLHEHSMDAGDKWMLSDAMDQPLYLWDGRGVHQQFSHDALGRPTDIDIQGLGLDHRVEHMVYGDYPGRTDGAQRNARGRLVEHYDQAGLLTILQYDPGGNPLHTERRLVQLRVNYSAEPDWTELSGNLLEDPFTTRTSFDALGRIVEQSLPDQTTRTLGYLPSGGVNQVLVTTEDGAYTAQPFLESAEYNARGQRTRALLGNDIEVSYEYDEQTFRLRRLTTAHTEVMPDGATVTHLYQDIEYTYDPAGNITRQLDHAQKPDGAHEDVLQGLNVSPLCEYTYDAFYQLTLATGRVHQALEQHDYRTGLDYPKIKGTQHLSLNNAAVVERYQRNYEYDPGGNIETIRHARLTPDGDTSLNWTQPIWTSEASNRSLPAEDLNGIPISNPEDLFDANGNCAYLPHLRSMVWNYRNNLARAVIIDRSAEGRVEDAEYYVYGCDGMRIRKVHERLVRAEQPGAQDLVEVTEKIYLDGCEIKRVHWNGDSLLERTTSHISDGSNRIALLHQWTRDQLDTETDDITQKKIHYQFSNHLGTSSLELDENRRVISYEEYFPFGGTSFIAGNNVREVELKEYRYTGKEWDDNTGFYYYGYRYYVPWIGNWLSPDPAGPVDTINLYQYVANNPVNVVDPNGLGNERLRRLQAERNRWAPNAEWRERAFRQQAAIPPLRIGTPSPAPATPATEGSPESTRRRATRTRPGSAQPRAASTEVLGTTRGHPAIMRMRVTPQAQEVEETLPPMGTDPDEDTPTPEIPAVETIPGESEEQVLETEEDMPGDPDVDLAAPIGPNEAEEEEANQRELAMTEEEVTRYEECEDIYAASQTDFDIETVGQPYPPPAIDIPQEIPFGDILREECPEGFATGTLIGTAIAIGSTPAFVIAGGAMFEDERTARVRWEREDYILRCVDPNLVNRENIQRFCTMLGGTVGAVGTARVQRHMSSRPRPRGARSHQPEEEITQPAEEIQAAQAERANTANEIEMAQAQVQAQPQAQQGGPQWRPNPTVEDVVRGIRTRGQTRLPGEQGYRQAGRAAEVENQIIEAIESGELRVNILEDGLFNRYVAQRMQAQGVQNINPQDVYAFHSNGRVYLRRSLAERGEITMHEGQHFLDFSRSGIVGRIFRGSITLREARAYWTETGYRGLSLGRRLRIMSRVLRHYLFE